MRYHMVSFGQNTYFFICRCEKQLWIALLNALSRFFVFWLKLDRLNFLNVQMTMVQALGAEQACVCEIFLQFCRVMFWYYPVIGKNNDTQVLYCYLTHWGLVTHICVGKLIIIGSDNGLSPGRRQAIIWTSAAILLIGPLGTNFTEILIEIQTFSLQKCVWKCRLRNCVHFVSASMC